MSAQLFYLPYQIAAKPTNIGAPGAKAYFYQPGTTTLTTIYADGALTVPLSNPVIANGAGQWPGIYLDGALTYRLHVTDKDDALLTDVDPYIPGSIDIGAITAAAGSAVSTKDLLAAISSPTAEQVAFFDGFVWQFDGSDLSTLVTADTRRAVYVAPTSAPTGASGAWVRQRESNHLHIDWFDPNGDGATDDTAAFAALRTLASALATETGGLRFGPEVHLGPKTYLLTSSYSWKGCSNIWRGCGAGSRGANTGITNIKMASGCTFTVEKGTTESGGVGTTISAFGADDTQFHDICFLGAGKGVGTAPIVKWRASAKSFNCRYVSGGGHGLAIDAQSGGGTSLEGEANDWLIVGGAFVGNGKSGLAIGTTASADTNAGICIGAYFAGNSEWGCDDNSFLGNQIHGEFAANTLGPFRTTQSTAASRWSGYIETGQGNAVLAQNAMWLGGARGDGLTGPYLSADLGYLSTNGFGRLTNAGGLFFVGADSFQAGLAGMFLGGAEGLALQCKAGSVNDFTLYTPAGTSIAAVPTGTSNVVWTGTVQATGFKVGANQVVGARQTGWAADTGTAKKTANATYSGTAEAAYTQATIQALMNAVRDLSQKQKAVTDALIAHGLVGA
jgi:hypothetical protein